MNEDLMPTPRSVDIAITGRCNLRCQYCYYADEMVARTDLSTTQWLSFFNELGKLGVMDICLTGGEIFTRNDLFELIDGIISSRMRYSLLTNATLITEKTLAQFEKGKRRQRLNSIQVSVDGSREEIHNLSRPNSFERTVRGLRLLKESGMPLTARVTINRNNLHDLENIAHFLLEEIGLPSFSSNDAMPLGNGCRNSTIVSLSSSEQNEAMIIFSRLLERYPGRLIATSGPQARIKKYSEMERARNQGEKPLGWQMGFLTGCGCVFNKMAIMHDGSIIPCLIMYNLVLGNILRDSLDEVWYNHPIMNALRERRNIPMKDVPGCGECDWVDYCNGDCPGLAFEMTRNFNYADPTACYRRFIMETGRA